MAVETINPKWSIWVDTGGTFTDCIAQAPHANDWLRLKVLSSGELRGRLLEPLTKNSFRIAHQWPLTAPIFEGYSFRISQRDQPLLVKHLDPVSNTITLDRPLKVSFPQGFSISAGEEAPILAARIATQTPLTTSFPPIYMRLGTTRGTNALLERKGARVALLITKGFGDLLYIGNQQRPNLFQLNIPEPRLLYESVFELDERLAADGTVLHPLDPKCFPQLLENLKEKEIESVAIALMHAYRNPVHEQLLAEYLRSNGFSTVSVSSELSTAIKLLPRARTAVVNAYLQPVLNIYLQQIQKVLDHPASSLLVMSSQGGLLPAASFRPKDSLLSGPAGGIVGAARMGQQLGSERILTLDMGGTSTDTAHYDGQFDLDLVTEIDGVELLSPTLAIETVAAGGGSVCWFDGARLRVGPKSAGARPGPACYGQGGPLTLTDVNLLLGKLQPEVLSIPIDKGPAQKALADLKATIEDQYGRHYSERELLRGFEQIADEKMADAIRKISVAKGVDPSNYTLVAFGGAGGLHCCRIAELLNIRKILLPRDAGLLSAYGIGQAQISRSAERTILQPLKEIGERLSSWVEALAKEALKTLPTPGVIESQTIYLRFRGQESSLDVPYQPQYLEHLFREKYESLFGHYPRGRVIEVERLRVQAATAPTSLVDLRAKEPGSLFEGNAPVALVWEALQEGTILQGPIVIAGAQATGWIAPGWRMEVQQAGNLFLERKKEPVSSKKEKQGEAIALELFTNRFRAIADEMGAQLQRTAFSINVRERLDFSCALLNPRAELLVNAPHIPVHLGSLGVCARLLLEKLPIGPGDVLITNHPKYGGSHLPDVSLLSGVFDTKQRLLGYVINRAHHAEIGGTRPGSMPPDAHSLEEEGVCIAPSYLVKAGQARWEQFEELLRTGPYPSRAVSENLADVEAALASLLSGERGLRALCSRFGSEQVHYYMDRLQDYTASVLQNVLQPLKGSSFSAVESLDDGHLIQVRIEVGKTGLDFNFEGTSPPHPGNLNANLSIVYSAVLYVLRLLCDQPIPLNEGLLRLVNIQLPNSFLRPPFSDEPAACPAVVGGNTEVSQRLVDTLLKALGLAACSQGTMNNFLFGNQHFGYYETIGGGAGAGPGFAGRSAVHQHMTNTRLTDPEILEWRYPVRLHQFGIRHGSGGRGDFPGGHGIRRELEFLEILDVTLLSQHRKVAPYGLQGGEPGATGRQILMSMEGTTKKLEGISHFTAAKGDRIIIETPGGGGYGH